MVILFFTLWVQSITITGDFIVDEKELRSAMILRQPSFFKKSEFHSEILKGDVDALKLVYLTHGFLKPEIEYEFDIDSTGPVHIRITIEEGSQTKVEKISFKGNTIFNRQDLISILKTKSGKPFNTFALEDDYLNIISIYDDIGYHDIQVTSEVSFNQYADIEYIISEGGKVYISEIETRGAGATCKDRLQDAIALYRGMILTNKKIAAARNRLYNLNLYNRIRIKEESLQSGRRLVFNLDPKEPISFGLRLGYSVLDGPQATMTVKHNNMFSSLRRVTVLGKMSWNERSGEINYRDPITFGTWLENGLGMRIKLRQEIGYQISRIGGYAVLNPLPFSIRYDIERIRVYDVEIDTLAVEGVEWLRTLSLSFTVDKRNHPLRPNRGVLIGNRIQFAGIFPQATSNFVRNEFRCRRFSPWLGTTIGFRFDFGVARPFSPSAEIPIHSRFFLGGATSMRGYSEKMIGPLDNNDNPLGGERYILLSFEERVPIFWLFSATFFTDVGSLEQRFNEKSLDPKMSVGFGLRLHTPLGPIRLDYGRNFEGSGSIHFAIGEAF